MSSSILDKLPSLVNISQEDVKSVNPVEEKQFILVFESKHKPEDVSLLSTYGRVLEYDNSYINIPLANHQFNYLCVDISEKQHRNLLQKENLDNYNVVVVCNWWQDDDDFVEDVKAQNILHSLPPKQAFKADFDRLLLSKKIRKPSCTKTVLRVLKKALNAWD
jgi:hypothetical protein